MFGKSKRVVDDYSGSSFLGISDAERKFHEMVRKDKAHTLAKDESLRLALITNEKEAGRVVDIAKPYYEFLYGEDGRGLSTRIKALETAANVGYGTPEETVNSARAFEGHLLSDLPEPEPFHE